MRRKSPAILQIEALRAVAICAPITALPDYARSADCPSGIVFCMFRTIFLHLAFCSGLVLSATAQKSSTTPPQDFQQAADRFTQSLIKSDTDALSEILTDDFLRTPPTRPSTTKSEYLAQLRSGTLKYLAIDLKEAKYQVYDNTVVENSVAAIRVRYNNQEINERLRLLQIWVRLNGKWRLAAVQGNPVPSS